MFLLVLAAAAVEPSAAQQPTQQAAPQEKVICKRQVDADTGSHFSASKRVCMKASDWKQLDDETQRAITNIKNRGGLEPVPLTGMGGGPG
ncbi:MAG TPA: hypothetical protein VJT70_03145 [Sphingomicrobium sp.]|nr:hypothetical protein [Sphingomicrobium sp.]